jgi:hypothetical protein
MAMENVTMTGGITIIKMTNYRIGIFVRWQSGALHIIFKNWVMLVSTSTARDSAALSDN